MAQVNSYTILLTIVCSTGQIHVVRA